MVSSARAVAAAAVIMGCAFAASAADIKPVQLKVVGTWGNLTNWQNLESPLWSKDVPAGSGGAITAQALPLTELGLKGFEIMRLLKLGVFDVAHALPIYIAEDSVLEGIDLAGVARNYESARQIAEAYRPILDAALKKTYNAKILNLYPWPSQVFFCRTPIKGIEDLKGKKIRVQGASQGDFVEAIGGTPVTIGFAEVVPSMEKGVVDCGITGTMPSYKAKWYEIATHEYLLPVGYTITFTAINQNSWNKLDAKGQEAFLKTMKEFEDRAWKVIEAEDAEGVACGTNTGPCSIGKPGNMTLVKPSEADLKVRDEALKNGVLKKWAARCGAECAKQWNETVGKIVGLTAGGS